MVAALMPLRAMTRNAASWMDWMRNSWTTSSFDRTVDLAMVQCAERMVSESEFRVSGQGLLRNPRSPLVQPRNRHRQLAADGRLAVDRLHRRYLHDRRDAVC